MTDQLYLASASPRRRELLTKMGVAFTARPRPVDERVDLPAREAVLELAKRKARAAADGLSEGAVLGADTLVSLGGRALGKPESAADAARMLRSLSGKTHEVYTGVCLADAKTGREMARVVTTRVTFRALTGAEIEAYVAGGEPMDKAGAYAIQGGAGAFVEAIDGSYENVMGLPVQALREMLDAFDAGRATE